LSHASVTLFSRTAHVMGLKTFSINTSKKLEKHSLYYMFNIKLLELTELHVMKS